MRQRETVMPSTTTDDRASVSGEHAADVPALQAENASLHDRLLRALADAENTRRRAERSAADARQFAVSDFSRELLNVVDNLHRAIEAAEGSTPERAEDAVLLEGIRATQRMLTTILERFGVKKIKAVGASFDPTLHEAMMEVDDTSHAPGSVASVMEDGYMIHDRLLRPARVVVAKRRSEPASPDAPEPPPIPKPQ
jgi:molecular chaperone GrpE